LLAGGREVARGMNGGKWEKYKGEEREATREVEGWVEGWKAYGKGGGVEEQLE